MSNKQTRMCIVLFKELLQNTLHKYQLASPCLRIMQSKMFVKMGFIKSMHLCIRWSVSWVCVASDWCHTAAPMSNTSAATLHRYLGSKLLVIVSRPKILQRCARVVRTTRYYPVGSKDRWIHLSVLSVRENAQGCKYATTACMSHFAWVVSQQVRRKSTMGYASVSYTSMSNTSVCTCVSTDYTGVQLPVCQTRPLRPFVCLFVMQHLFAPRVNPQPCRVYLFAIQP